MAIVAKPPTRSSAFAPALSAFDPKPLDKSKPLRICPPVPPTSSSRRAIAERFPLRAAPVDNRQSRRPGQYRQPIADNPYSRRKLPKQIKPHPRDDDNRRGRQAEQQPRAGADRQQSPPQGVQLPAERLTLRSGEIQEAVPSFSSFVLRHS